KPGGVKAGTCTAKTAPHTTLRTNLSRVAGGATHRAPAERGAADRGGICRKAVRCCGKITLGSGNLYNIVFYLSVTEYRTSRSGPVVFHTHPHPGRHR